MPVIEVAWATDRRQILRRQEVPEGTTLEQAVAASGVLEELGSEAPLPLVLGVFGRLRAPGDVVRDGDRIELHRPLIADPKETRRQRARDRPLPPRGRRQR